MTIAVLDRNGRTVTFSPGLPSIRSALTTRCIGVRWNAATTMPVPLAYPASDVQGEWITRAGLAPVAARLFEDAHFDVVYRATGIVPRAPRRVRLRRPDGSEPIDLLNFVQTHDEGLIRVVEDRVDPVRLMADVALAYPWARVVAVTDSRRLGRDIARRLSASLGRVHAFDCRPRAELQLEELPRVCVSTFIGLVQLDVEHGIDFLFVPNVTELTSKRADLAVVRAGHARVFGFVPCGQQLSQFESDIVRSLLGFAELTLVDNRLSMRPIEVVRTQLRGPFVRTSVVSPDFLRHHVWHDPIRTRRVKSLASYLRMAECMRMRDRFPDIATALACEADVRRNVVIVCDNVEHAWHMQRNLRQPSLLIGTGEQMRGQTFTFAVMPPSTATNPVQVITTRDALANGCVDIKTIDALIVAGENPHALRIPNHLLGSSTARKLLIIEMIDFRSPPLRHWALSRLNEYLERGILAPGVDPVRGRVDHFLRSRCLRGVT